MVLTVAICASERQVSPVSVPPGQRKLASTCIAPRRQPSTLLTTLSATPSSVSQAAMAAACTISVLLMLSQPAPPFR
ncbi:hypothetical protein D3C87_1104970 [compost metagenome]